MYQYNNSNFTPDNAWSWQYLVWVWAVFADFSSIHLNIAWCLKDQKSSAQSIRFDSQLARYVARITGFDISIIEFVAILSSVWCQIFNFDWKISKISPGIKCTPFYAKLHTEQTSKFIRNIKTDVIHLFDTFVTLPPCSFVLVWPVGGQ